MQIHYLGKMINRYINDGLEISSNDSDEEISHKEPFDV